MSETTWKLVPEEATEEMVTRSGLYKWATYSQVAEGFESALSAAPKPAPGLYEVRDDGTARRVEVDEAVERVARVVLWKAMGFQYTGDRLTDESNPRGVRATKTARAVLRALTGDGR